VGREYQIQLRSLLAADSATVWAHASTLDGVNAELAPLHMSGPRGIAIELAPLGRPAFRSLVTLFRLLPLDLHELTLVEVAPGRGFHERSRSLLEARWIHKRSIDPVAGGCVVVDDLTFEPRVLGGLIRRIIARAFARRHAYLRKRFGTLD
jgi:hypothetical protein